jgi:hypothetical protein
LQPTATHVQPTCNPPATHCNPLLQPTCNPLTFLTQKF